MFQRPYIGINAPPSHYNSPSTLSDSKQVRRSDEAESRQRGRVEYERINFMLVDAFDRNFCAAVYDENNRVCWGPLQTRMDTTQTLRPYIAIHLVSKHRSSKPECSNFRQLSLVKSRNTHLSEY